MSPNACHVCGGSGKYLTKDCQLERCYMCSAIKRITREVYVASDGREFPDQTAAEKHEHDLANTVYVVWNNDPEHQQIVGVYKGRLDAAAKASDYTWGEVVAKVLQ